jgi:FG-GAP-like repeat
MNPLTQSKNTTILPALIALTLICFGFSPTAPGDLYASDVATNSATGLNSPQGIFPPKADFNGDGKSDILWQNNSTGERVIWLMNGTSLISSVSLGVVGTSWNIVGSEDFNRDLNSDILWQNSVTGERVIWLMSGTSLSSTVSLGIVWTAWNIVGSGDFNGDGKPDILWQNSVTGERVIWLMNGTSLSSTVSLGIVGTSWSIVGSGDFNADGMPDILWQNNCVLCAASAVLPPGERVIWLMNGTSFSSSVSLGIVGTSWNIAGAADYSGDGQTDILWQNSVTGERVIWLMNGTSLSSTVSLGIVGTAWDIRNY